MIKDQKNRLYSLDGVDCAFTHMTCLTTGAIIKVANQHFSDMGFISC